MTGLYIAGGIVLFLALLLFAVPLHLTVSAEETVSVSFRVLFIKFPLYPKEQKKKKSAAKKKKSSQKGSKKTEVPSQRTDVLALIRLIRRIVKEIIRKLSHHLRIRVHAYEIAVATEDAAKTAILCGACRGASENLFALFSEVSNFKVKKGARVAVFPDYTGEKTRAFIKVDLYTHLFGGLSTLLAAGLAFAKNKNQTKKK